MTPKTRKNERYPPPAESARLDIKSCRPDASIELNRHKLPKRYYDHLHPRFSREIADDLFASIERVYNVIWERDGETAAIDFLASQEIMMMSESATVVTLSERKDRIDWLPHIMLMVASILSGAAAGAAAYLLPSMMV